MKLHWNFQRGGGRSSNHKTISGGGGGGVMVIFFNHIFNFTKLNLLLEVIPLLFVQ